MSLPLKLKNRIENFCHYSVAVFYVRLNHQRTLMSQSLLEKGEFKRVAGQYCETNLHLFVEKIPAKFADEAQDYAYNFAMRFAVELTDPEIENLLDDTLKRF